MRRILRAFGRPAGVLALVVVVVAWDIGRRPERQMTARLYVGGVQIYQGTLGPIVSRFVSCRYRPSCSDYSIQAVRRFGIRRGLVLTVRRVLSCRPPVPRGTLDPVPPAAGPPS